MTFFGCVGCAVSVPLWYFGSLLTESYIVTVVLGMIYGILLAGFVPLSALMPSMVERHDKGASLAILNTGAGGAAFVGRIATALNPFVGYGGVVIAYSVLYFVSAVLTTFIVETRPIPEKKERWRKMPSPPPPRSTPYKLRTRKATTGLVSR